MNVDNPYNLNLESTESQTVSENRADESVLKETFKDFFGELNYFFARVLHVWFKNGKLYACGAYNLGFPKMS